MPAESDIAFKPVGGAEMPGGKSRTLGPAVELTAIIEAQQPVSTPRDRTRARTGNTAQYHRLLSYDDACASQAANRSLGEPGKCSAPV
jgi:hypothetical protein